jgi:hypothetical protein
MGMKQYMTGIKGMNSKKMGEWVNIFVGKPCLLQPLKLKYNDAQS